MNFLHLSDLHLGKRVNDVSMLQDQRYILTELLKKIDEKKPQAVFIAGDIYDKPVPSAEAVELFDDFLTELANRNLSVFIISGNHDSAERIAFGSAIFKNGGIYTAGVFKGKLDSVLISDEYGELEIVLMPFLKPFAVREALGDESIESYNDAVRAAIETVKPFSADRRIIIAHQFVSGAVPSDSESISVGGVDMIDAQLFDDFNYAALGHIHRMQKVKKEEVKYCGTLLKYSSSECGQEKAALFGEIRGDGSVKTESVAISPIRDMRKLCGTYVELCNSDNYKNTNTEDYVYITLSDENEVPDAVQKLRAIYPNIMQLEYSALSSEKSEVKLYNNIESLSPVQLFENFFEERNGKPLTDEQRAAVQKTAEKIWEE